MNLSRQPCKSSAVTSARPEGIQAPLQSRPQSKPRCATFFGGKKEELCRQQNVTPTPWNFGVR